MPSVVGWVPVVIGMVIAILTLPKFWKHGTNLNVHRPTTTIITDGPYRYSRNPAYLALTLLYVGVSILLASFWALVLVVPAVLTLTYGVIVREERYLDRKFGDDYRRYKASVRRWI